MLLIASSLGFRPDLWLAMHGSAFWMKWGYTASLGICALAATAKLARPDSRSLGWLWLALVPVAGLALAAGAETACWHAASARRGSAASGCKRTVMA